MRLCFTFLALCCGLTLGHAEVICNLADPQTKIILRRAQETGQSASIQTMPDGKPALRLNWDSKRANHFEFALKAPVRLPEFEAATIRLDVYVPENCQARNLNIRLGDAHGERLQYRVPLPAGKPGWRQLIFNIDPQEAPEAGSWAGGSKANGRIDFPVSLVGIASEVSQNAGSAWLGFGEIAFEVTSNPPELSLETGRATPVHVFLPGEENAPILQVRNRRPQKRDYSLEYKLATPFGETILEKTEQFRLEPDAVRRIALPFPTVYGVYPLEVRLHELPHPGSTGTQAQAPAQIHRMSYSYMQPAGPTPGRPEGFLFGICLHTQRFDPETQEREALAAALMGAKVYREDIIWRLVETAPGVWDWSRYDALIDLYAHYNMEIQALLIGNVRWHSEQMHRGDAPPPEWGEFARNFAERYRDRVRYVEIWNEPNHRGSLFQKRPAFFVKLMELAWNNIKSVAPEMVVLTPGFTGTIGPEASVNFTRHVLEHGKGFYETIAIHAHGAFPSYIPHVNALNSMRREFDVPVPWYANETGQISAHNWPSEMDQGYALFKKMLYSWAEGAMGYNWYELRNGGFDPNYVEHNYGLMSNDFYPKPAYGVYNMLANTFSGAEYLQPVYLGDNLNSYFFRAKNGDILLPSWSNDSSQRLLNVTGITGEATLIDIFGNETQLPVIEGSVALIVGPVPSTLRLANQPQIPALGGEFIVCNENFNIASGAEQTLEIQLNNPTSIALDFTIESILPEGISTETELKELYVKQGHSIGLAIPLRAREGFYSLPERPRTIELKTQIRTADGNLFWEGSLSREIHTLVTISERGFALTPDFELNDASQVTRIVASAIANEPYYWQGPEDLSARIWLGRDKQNLLLKVVVTDDVHHQPYSGHGVWRGDNIQVGLRFYGHSGLWELGLTRRNDGENETFVWLASSKFDTDQVASQIQLNTIRDEQAKTTTYEAKIPFHAIGINESVGRRGFRFNLLVNDNDGYTRESYICIAPGIADEKSPRRYPTVSFE